MMLVGFLIALLISIQVVVAARAQSNSDTSLQTARAGDIMQQQEPPVGDPAERMQLAFPGFRPGGENTGLFPGRLMSQDFDDWPPMLHIGDSAEIAGKTFTVKEILLVPGSDRSIAYEPATGKKRFAPEGLRTNLFDFSKNTEVFIPPNSTLVMVKIEVVPEAQMHQTEAICLAPNERDYANFFRLSYPELGELPVILTTEDEYFGEYSSPTHYCITTGWNYFVLNSLNITPSKIWFEIVDEEFQRELSIWNTIP
jgi:hypothetical protein